MYYENTATGETTWDKPAELELATQSPVCEDRPLSPDDGTFDVSTPPGRRVMLQRLREAVGRPGGVEALEKLIRTVESGGTEEDWKWAADGQDGALLRLLAKTLVQDAEVAKLGIRALVMLQRAWNGSWAKLLGLDPPSAVLGEDASPLASWEAFLLERATAALTSYVGEEQMEDRMVWLMALADAVSQDGGVFKWGSAEVAERLEALLDVLLDLLASAPKEEYSMASRALICINALAVRPTGGRNVVIEKFVSHAAGTNLMESLMYELNDSSSMEDLDKEGTPDHRWLLKFFSDLFEDSKASHNFHRNDLHVVVDIIIRGIETFDVTSPLLPDYLALLAVVLTKSSWSHQDRYRKSDIRCLLEGLQRSAEYGGENTSAVLFLVNSTLSEVGPLLS